MEKDNKDRTLIKLEWIRGVEMLVEDRNLRERIKKVQKEDKKIVKAVEELKKAGMKNLRGKEWLIEEGVVMREGRIYVLKGELRGEIVCLYHNTLVEGHEGR